jgi:hypothetical protein
VTFREMLLDLYPTAFGRFASNLDWFSLGFRDFISRKVRKDFQDGSI